MSALQNKYDTINSILAVLTEYIKHIPDTPKIVEPKKTPIKTTKDAFVVIEQLQKSDHVLQECYQIVIKEDPENMSGLSHSTSVKLKDMQLKIAKVYSRYINNLKEINANVYQEIYHTITQFNPTPQEIYENAIKYKDAFDLYAYIIKHEIQDLSRDVNAKYEHIRLAENYKNIALNLQETKADLFKTGNFIPQKHHLTLEDICRELNIEPQLNLTKTAKISNINIVLFTRHFGTPIYYVLPTPKNPDPIIVSDAQIKKIDISLEIFAANTKDKTIFLESIEPGKYNILSIWTHNFIMSYSYTKGFYNYLDSPTENRSAKYHQLQNVDYMFVDANIISSHESLKVDIPKLAGTPKYTDIRQELFLAFFKFVQKQFDSKTDRKEIYNCVTSEIVMNEFVNHVIYFNKPHIDMTYLYRVFPKLLELKKLFFKAIEDGFNTHWYRESTAKNFVDLNLIINDIIKDAIFKVVDKNDLIMCEVAKWKSIEITVKQSK